MNITLVAINSRHIHTNLSTRYLKKAIEHFCSDNKVVVVETNINQPIRETLSSVVETSPHIIALSCYIFNIEYVRKLVGDIKRAVPSAHVVLGGPEVTFNAKQTLLQNKDVDFVVCGEGENALPKLISSIELENKKFPRGVSYRRFGEVVEGGPSDLIDDLDSIVSPYDEEMLEAAQGKILYYESSRGCPYGCTYCLSSVEQGVRYFSLERVASDLEKIFKSFVKQVKFVDRTFNANKKRASAIIRFIVNSFEGKNYPPKNFHFEVAPNLFDEELYQVIESAPPGLIQFEIGIQSFNSQVLHAVNRKIDMDESVSHVKRLIGLGNAHIHLGLIAGLPGETLDMFAESFNQAYSLKAQQFQLGFLKFLHGTELRSNAFANDYEFSSYPPYQIVKGKSISFDELCLLEAVEGLVDRYYNSNKFVNSLAYLVGLSSSPFEFYEKYAGFLQNKNVTLSSCSFDALYVLLLEFLSDDFRQGNLTVLENLLVYDYLSSTRTFSLPKALRAFAAESVKPGDFVRDDDWVENNLPHRRGQRAKEIIKDIYLQKFSIDTKEYFGAKRIIAAECLCVFDYSVLNPVTEQYWSNLVAPQFA